MSDDGAWALVVILFVGSAFSPWYARARRNGGGRPGAHLALNAALYGPRPAWSMVEAPEGAAYRTPEVFVFQDSVARWEGRTLSLRLDAPGTPFGGAWRPGGPPLAGSLRLYADRWFDRTWPLDPGGHHRWHPVAPVARAEVALTAPAVRFEGSAYHDANQGDRPLEDDFDRWSWGRWARPGGARVVYDAVPRRGPPAGLALDFDRGGLVRSFDPGPSLALGRSRWGLSRAGRIGRPRRVVPLEDTPFYTRSLVESADTGHPSLVVHESLSLDRFRRPWVRALLPFRSRRVTG